MIVLVSAIALMIVFFYFASLGRRGQSQSFRQRYRKRRQARRHYREDQPIDPNFQFDTPVPEGNAKPDMH